MIICNKELIDSIDKIIDEVNGFSDEQLQRWSKSKECYDYLHR